MALSSWDTLAINKDGSPCNGEFTSPLGVTVEFYKNWLYIRDKKAWQEESGYSKPYIMTINSGDSMSTDVGSAEEPVLSKVFKS